MNELNNEMEDSIHRYFGINTDDLDDKFDD